MVVVVMVGGVEWCGIGWDGIGRPENGRKNGLAQPVARFPLPATNLALPP